MIRKWNQMQFKYKVFFYLLIVAVIPTLILGIYSYSTYRSAMERETGMSVESALEQMKLRVDSTLDSLRKYYIELVGHEEITWLMENNIDYSDYSKLVKAQDGLSCSAYLAEYISGYTFINYDTGWVLSNRGMFLFQDAIHKEMVETYRDGFSRWVNNTELEPPINVRSKEIQVEGILFYHNLPLNSRNKNSLMIINVDIEKINNQAADRSSNFEMTIIDQDGKLVYGSDAKISQHFVDYYENYKGSTEIQEVELDEQKIYRVGSLQSDVVQWTYFIAWNTEGVAQGALNIAFMTVILIVIIALLLLIFSLTRFIYQPIANLREYVSSVVEEEVPQQSKLGSFAKDDFRTISGGIDTLVDNSHALERLIQVQKEQLSEFFLTRLISGTLDLNQISQYFDKLGICPGTYYAVLTVGLANLMNEEYDEAKQDALRLEVMENIPEEIRKRLIMEPSCNARVITLVVSGENEKEVDQKVIEAYKGLDIFVQMQYKFPIKVGVSTIHSEWKLFRNAHNEAIEALKNNELLHHDAQSSDFTGVMFYSDIETSPEKVAYDRLAEKEVREAVDSGDLEKAFTCVEQFLKHLFEKNVPHMERQFCMNHFMNEILMVAVDAGISLDEVFDGRASDVFQSLNHLYDMGKIGSFFKYSLIQPIINGLNEFRTSRSSQIIKEIIESIEEAKGDITLAECADRLNYHSTYIWKVMKIEKNTTFSDYVARYKVEEAKKLLLETDLTVNEIASRLNYTNAQNFIRFFSRIEGTTPGKFRTANKPVK